MSEKQANQLPPSTSKVDFTKPIDRSALKDQSILITGGASGIGEAYVETLAEAGAYVTFFDLSEVRAQAIVQRQTDRGNKVNFVQGDVRSWDDQVRAFEAASSFSPFQSLDIVIIAAGLAGKSILKWLNEQDSPDGKPVRPNSDVIDINLTGTFNTTHLALHYFRRSLKTENRVASSKQIVFISSLAGYSGNSYISDYAASKWGVRGIWRTLRNENYLLGSDTSVKFRSSLLAPWFVKTSLTESIQPIMDKLGIPFAGIEDCIDSMLRIVCDEEVKGRAIAVAPKGQSFDLCDDYEGLDAGREWPQKMREGVFGSTSSFGRLTEFFHTRSGIVKPAESIE